MGPSWLIFIKLAIEAEIYEIGNRKTRITEKGCNSGVLMLFACMFIYFLKSNNHNLTRKKIN